MCTKDRLHIKMGDVSLLPHIVQKVMLNIMSWFWVFRPRILSLCFCDFLYYSNDLSSSLYRFSIEFNLLMSLRLFVFLLVRFLLYLCLTLLCHLCVLSPRLYLSLCPSHHISLLSLQSHTKYNSTGNCPTSAPSTRKHNTVDFKVDFFKSSRKGMSRKEMT